MLLDRRKIRRWAKWVALILAIIFVVSFLFMGVGYGGAGFNISEIFTQGGCSSDNGATTGTTSLADQLAAYEQALQVNPNDTAALLGEANIFNTLYQQGEGAQYLRASAQALEAVVAADPTQKDIYLRLANIYLSQDGQDYTKAVAILNKAVDVDPQNPDVYLKLGVAQQNLNNKSAAVLAWQKYLELEPNGEMAPTIREQIQKLSETTTTTKPASTTSTAAAPATTTTAK